MLFSLSSTVSSPVLLRGFFRQTENDRESVSKQKAKPLLYYEKVWMSLTVLSSLSFIILPIDSLIFLSHDTQVAKGHCTSFIHQTEVLFSLLPSLPCLQVTRSCCRCFSSVPSQASGQRLVRNHGVLRVDGRELLHLQGDASRRGCKTT